MHAKRIPLPPTPSEFQALGRAIRELRTSRDLSPAVLARRCHTCRTYVSAVERGEANPTFASVVRLLKAFDITFGDLAETYAGHFRPQP